MINTKNIISITEARKRIFELTDDVQKTAQNYTLTENGRAKAVLISADEYESMVETLEVMRENPQALEDIRRSQLDFAHGEYEIWEPKQTKAYTSPVQNYVVAEKGANYVSGSSTKKSRKAKK